MKRPRSASSTSRSCQTFATAASGTTLLRGLQSEAAAAGKPLRIHVERFNPALTLHERLGFTPVADRGVYLFMDVRVHANRDQLTRRSTEETNGFSPDLLTSCFLLVEIFTAPSILERFRKEARRSKVGYQTLINEVLAEHAGKE